MVYHTQHDLSEDMTTTKTTKTTLAEMTRRTVAYGLVEDYVDDDVDVGDGSDGCVPTRREGSRLLLRRCDYNKEQKLDDEGHYLDSGNILYTTCFDSVHERNTKRNE